MRSPARGRIVTTQSLDREDMSTYQLFLMAEDRGDSSFSTTVPLIISLLDQNDNSPLFSQPSWIFELPENTNGTLVTTFNVS